MIYFIQAVGTPYVKIGYAKRDNVKNRIATLQTGSPHRLELLGTMPGGLQEEYQIHESNKARHYRGEWFVFDDNNEIEWLISATTQPEQPDPLPMLPYESYLADAEADAHTMEDLLRGADTPRETARVLNVSRGTLSRWRSEGRGPKFLKLGSEPTAPIRYRPADIKTFLEESSIE